jgi:hypothetical protein
VYPQLERRPTKGSVTHQSHHVPGAFFLQHSNRSTGTEWGFQVADAHRYVLEMHFDYSRNFQLSGTTLLDGTVAVGAPYCYSHPIRGNLGPWLGAERGRKESTGQGCWVWCVSEYVHVPYCSLRHLTLHSVHEVMNNSSPMKEVRVAVTVGDVGGIVCKSYPSGSSHKKELTTPASQFTPTGPTQLQGASKNTVISATRP